MGSVPTPVAELTPANLRLPTQAAQVPENNTDMSFLTAQSVACLVTGGAATVAAVGLGWQNVTNLISGGVVPAAGPGAVALGLFGVVFTSFCAIGQALTPLYLDLTNGQQRQQPTGDLPQPERPGAEQTISPFVVRTDIRAAPVTIPVASTGCNLGSSWFQSRTGPC